MANLILYGGALSPDAYQYQQYQTDDDGTAVALRSTTSVWAPSGWWGEAVFRTCVVIFSTNVGATVRLTPVVDGVPYDGTNDAPDCRVSYTIATPAAGERQVSREIIGVYRPIRFEGDPTVLGRVGLRGTYFQFVLDSIGAIDVPSGEANPDLRFEGVELDPEPARRTTQVVNSA